MRSKNLVFASCVLLLASCDNLGRSPTSRVLECQTTLSFPSLVEWLTRYRETVIQEIEQSDVPASARGGIVKELDARIAKASEEDLAISFSVNIDTGDLEMDPESGRPLGKSVIAKGWRGNDFWAVYEANFYGMYLSQWTETLVIQLPEDGSEIPFGISGVGSFSSGVCIQGQLEN